MKPVAQLGDDGSVSEDLEALKARVAQLEAQLETQLETQLEAAEGANP